MSATATALTSRSFSSTHGIEALFNARYEYCRPLEEHDDVPWSHFVVRLTKFELMAFEERQASLEMVNGRWQVRITKAGYGWQSR
jgi:hypothetical protein